MRTGVGIQLGPARLASVSPLRYTTAGSGENCMTADDTVIARRDGRVGRILLNRPRCSTRSTWR